MTVAVGFSPTNHNEAITISADNSTATRNSIFFGTPLKAISDLNQSSKKRYIELTVINIGAGVRIGVGNGAMTISNNVGDNTNIVYWNLGNIVFQNAFQPSTVSSFTTGDIIGIKLDLDAHTVTFNKNNGTFSVPSTDISSLGTDIFICACLEDNPATASVQFNNPPMFAAPSGYVGWVDAPNLTQPVNPLVNVIAHGDSITLGGNVTETYFDQTMDLLSSSFANRASWVVAGVNGVSWEYAWPDAGYPLNMRQDAPVRVDPRKAGGIPNWLVLFAGTNGILLNNDTAAQEFAAFTDYFNDRIAAGWLASQIIVCTMLPRTGVTDTIRQSYNSSLVSQAAVSGYKLARFDLDPNMGQTGDNLNTTYYQDGTHPTFAGAKILAGILFPQITQVLLGTFTPAVLAPVSTRRKAYA